MRRRPRAAHVEREQKDDENSLGGGSVSGGNEKKLLTSDAASQKSFMIHQFPVLDLKIIAECLVKETC